MEVNQLKIVFFSPHADVWVHAFPEALVAESLRQRGHKVVYVGCGRDFGEYCVPMRASALAPNSSPDSKRSVCARCERRRDLLRDRFQLQGYDLGSLLDPADVARAESIVDRATPETFLDIILDGVEVGRSALSTYILSFKKGDLRFSQNEWAFFKIELRNTLKSFFACRSLLAREKPDRILLYSSGYSVNLVWCLLAERMGVPFYYMNAGANLSDRLQKLVISRGHSLQRRLLTFWDTYRDIPCAPSTADYVTDHLVEVMHGRSVFVYSSGRTESADSARNYFGVREGQRVLLATMSSYDELFAAQITGLFPTEFELLFPRQVDWILACIAWVRSKPDLFLIVRVHPREFPNKRDSVKSDHALELERALVDLPDNVRINWPSDDVSLYDLAKITDVCLNSWSSVGKEMSMFGVPTVLYNEDLVFYPADLNLLGTSPQRYFACIEEALARGWNAECMRKAFRWQALEDQYSRLDISDGFRRKESVRATLAVRVVNRLRRKVDPDFAERADCNNRPPVLRAGSRISKLVESGADSVVSILDPREIATASLEEETESLRRQARRIAVALYADIDAARRSNGLGAHLCRFAEGDQ